MSARMESTRLANKSRHRDSFFPGSVARNHLQQRYDMDQPPIVPNPTIAPLANIVWPKRTPKACSNCRRDKVRCDGEKPCGGCTRKNIQCNEGCEPCRRARARCEKNESEDRCMRCITRELECTDEHDQPLTATSTSFSSVEANSAPPLVGERTKFACQNCCQSNKKCDNQRPCSRCVSRSETCVPAAPRVRKQARLRCEACKKQSIRCDDARPCQNCVTAGMECINVERQSRGCGTRVKAACLACRQSKSRCDGNRPCGPCTRRKSECIGQLCRRCAHDGSTTCAHTGPGQTASTSSSDPDLPLPVSSISTFPPNQPRQYPMPLPWSTAMSHLPGHPPPMHSLQQPGPSYENSASNNPPHRE